SHRARELSRRGASVLAVVHGLDAARHPPAPIAAPARAGAGAVRVATGPASSGDEPDLERDDARERAAGPRRPPRPTLPAGRRDDPATLGDARRRAGPRSGVLPPPPPDRPRRPGEPRPAAARAGRARRSRRAARPGDRDRALRRHVRGGDDLARARAL